MKTCFNRSVKSILNFAIFIILLVFVSCQSNESDVAEKVASGEEVALFELIDPQRSGVDFNNNIKETRQLNSFIYDGIYQGAGVAAGDINNDGLPDLYFAGNQKPGKLYLNKGNFKFKDITKSAGLDGITGWASGVNMVDVDGDGDLDLYICRHLYQDPEIRKNLVYINNGNKTFSEKSEEIGLADAGYTMMANFFDYDRDGDLDAYIVNQPPNFEAFRASKERGKINYAYTDRLYQNNGGKYTDVTQQAGLLNYAYGLSASIGDFNHNGWMDIYVANDYTEPDYFYINLGNGTFTNVADVALKHMSNFSMGSDVADFNNDGHADIYVADMVAEDNYRLKANMSGMNPQRFWDVVNLGYHYQYMFNVLQMNNGNGSFSDIAQMAGVSNTDWSWATLFGDFDNDGYKDIYVTNGIKKDLRNTDFNKQLKKNREKKIKEANDRGDYNYQPDPLEFVALMPGEKLPNYMFRNNGSESDKALTFSKISQKWGLSIPSFSQGAVYSDLDKDGDLDLVINNMEDPAFIFKNKARETLSNNYLTIKFEGKPGNPTGIGAKVIIKYNNGQLQTDHLATARGFISSVEPIMHFGLGQTDKIDTIRVDWPDGNGQIMFNIPVNQVLTLKQTESTALTPYPWNRQEKYFTNITGAIERPFEHKENAYDDYKNEILIPHKMSELGPCVTSADINGDDREDFFVGGASGQSGILYLQNEQGQFLVSESLAFSQHKDQEDLAAEFFDADGDGDQDLYVGSGGNEKEPGSAYYQDRLYINNGEGKFSNASSRLPAMTESAGTVESVDFDGDGDMDLFVGARQQPGKYPFPVTSRLLINTNGKFVDQTENICPDFIELGMVTDAIWTDLNNDDRPDLLLTGEWMPVTIFENNDGVLIDKTIEYGLAESTGWWNTAEAGDMDGDGDMDFVLGNLGYNIKYKASSEEPFGVHSKDFDGNGSNDIVLSYYNYGKNYPLRGRSCSSDQIGAIGDSFPTYHAFASATLEDVYEPFGLEEALSYEAKQFATCYMENKGDGTFEFHPLHNRAQVSTTNGIVLHDFNGDSNLDIIIAGNHFDREIETTRSDAGIGLLLLGDGTGNFNPVDPDLSGINIGDDVKGLRLIESVIKGNPVILAVKNDGTIQAVQYVGKLYNTQVSLK